MKNFCIMLSMDCSGSMSRTKRLKAKEHYSLVRDGIKNGQEVLDRYYVQFTTSVKHANYNFRNNEDAFFTSNHRGGTYLSSGLKEVLSKVEQSPEDVTNIVFMYSDGDNWREDNDIFIDTLKELSKKNTIFVFVNVAINSYFSNICSRIIEEQEHYENPVLFQKIPGSSQDTIEEAAKEAIEKINSLLE